MQDNTGTASGAGEESREGVSSAEDWETGKVQRNIQFSAADQELQDEAAGLPIARPAAKPKLKINARYAKPAKDAPSAETDGLQKGTADGV